MFAGYSSAAVTTLSPGFHGQALRHDPDALARVFDECDVVLCGPKDLARQVAYFLDALFPSCGIDIAVLGRVLGPLGHRPNSRRAQGRDSSMIEKRPTANDRKLIAQCSPVHHSDNVISVMGRLASCQSFNPEPSARVRDRRRRWLRVKR